MHCKKSFENGVADIIELALDLVQEFVQTDMENFMDIEVVEFCLEPSDEPARRNSGVNRPVRR